MKQKICSTPANSHLTQTQVQDQIDLASKKHPCWTLISIKDHDLWEKREQFIKNSELPQELAKVSCECGHTAKEGQMV
jgi:hypothetical protein